MQMEAVLFTKGGSFLKRRNVLGLHTGPERDVAEKENNPI